MYRMNKLLIIQEICLRNSMKLSSTNQVRPLMTTKDMPRPRSLPIIGTALDFLLAGRGKKLHEYIDNRHKKLGPIFCEKLERNSDLVFISDPELMKTLFINLEGKYPTHILPEPWVLYGKLYGSKRGLFFMDGEEWLSNRRVINKHLLREDSEKWLEIPVRGSIEKFIENWKVNTENTNFKPSLESQFYRLSTDVIISVLLGTHTSFTINERNEELLKIFSEVVKRIFQTTTDLSGLPVKWCQRLNLRVWSEFKECVDFSLFLAEKIVIEMINVEHDDRGLVKKLCRERITYDTIKRIVADLVIAAGDTTAYTSLWILYLLSQNKQVIKEIRENDISYVKFVVKEAMRLYPVAPFLTRILPKESVLGQYKLEKGTPVVASIYTSGRNEKYFSKADEFLPYRWNRNDPRRKDLVNHVPSASLPFAFGSRSCIGKKIAMLQLTEVIYQIVNTFDFEYINETKVNPIMSQVLIPNQSIELLITRKK